MSIKYSLNRKTLTVGFTLGLLCTGASQYYTVEDTVRPMYINTNGKVVGKIKGETAIPAGEYQIVDTYSPKYKKNMLRLLNVKTHTGILIHSGNTALDSEGCIIIGMKQTPNGVAESRIALDKFEKEVRQALKNSGVYLIITDNKG